MAKQTKQTGMEISNALLAQIDRIYTKRYSHGGDVGANAFKTGYLMSQLAAVLEMSPSARKRVAELVVHLAGKPEEPAL